MLLSCQQVNKSYGDKKVLDEVNLDVPEGQFFGLVGMNGSGKSTLMKATLDLVGIDSGSISINNVSHRHVDARSNLAYLPDRFSPPVHLRGIDFIRYMLDMHGCKKSDGEISNTLASLDLPQSVMRESVNKLSKGMTQKLGLASCLLSGKTFLMLDEPMSGLDPRARVLFKQQLASLKDSGVTVFFSSHVLADVDEIAENMAVLHKSKIRFTGTPAEFKEEYKVDNLEQAYMQCIEQYN